ncbi:MAG: hypothetical protein KF788_05685 [Piscinibacter sp.]|nr:hypothetical protein [Piscinibacter sp.]
MATDPHDPTGPHDEADHVFEVLAGRRAGGPGTDALRDALHAQARTLREAEQARAEDFSEAERAQMDGLKRRLQAAGAFRPEPVPPAAPGWGERLRALLLGDSWHRPVALAAGVLLASVLLLRLTAPGDDDDPSRTLRGGAASVVTAQDPAAASAALEARLRAAGAEVLRVQIGAAEWSLRVTVPDAARLSAVRQLLREAGFAAEGEPPFELGVRAP